MPSEGTISLVVGGISREVPYRIRRMKRTHNLRLRVDYHGVALLTIPWHCPYPDALRFLATKQDWLFDQLDQQASQPSLKTWLETEAGLSVDGHRYTVAMQPTRGKSYPLIDDARRDIMLCYAGSGDADTELKRLCQLVAKRMLPKRVHELASGKKLPLQRIGIRDQSSRWGSCSTRGTLSLNWRLLLMPPALQDHVILHELAHLREMNHSERFWACLRDWDPQTDTHNRQLNDYARKLMPLGR